jgi:uncharacterized membrane protein YdjX (TVP38/TMEM64 family)
MRSINEDIERHESTTVSVRNRSGQNRNHPETAVSGIHRGGLLPFQHIYALVVSDIIPSVRVFASPRYRRLAIAGIVVFGLSLASLYLTLRAYFPFIFNTSELRALLQQFGVLSPAVYIFAHTIQVVTMAIPGYAIAVVGGVLFGPFFGTVYTMIGVTVGSAIAFLIARNYGRPLVERMIHEDALDRFDAFIQNAGLPGLFLFVLIPVLPEDVISFVAGLSHFRLSVFLIAIFLGRLPAAAVAVLAGDGIATNQFLEASIWLLSLVFASVYTYYYRDHLLERISAF